MLIKIKPLVLASTLLVCAPYSFSASLTGQAAPPSIGAGTVVVDFESQGDVSAASFTVNGVLFEGLGGSIRNSSIYANDYNSVGRYLDNNAGGTNGIKVTFVAPTSKFAFNWGAADVNWTLKAYNSSNTLLETLVLTPTGTSNLKDYFGISATAITYFTVEASSSGDWVFIDNLVCDTGCAIIGPSSIDTQSSLEQSLNRLKAVYNIQSAALINGLSYDCQLFDVNNICLSTGGRYSNNHGAYGGTTSALLIGAYRLDKNVRVGAWVDQNLSTNTTTGVNLGNSKPLVGVFGVWSENPNGEGYEVKVSAGYGDKDLTVTRDVIGTSEPGTGNSRVNSQAISSVSSYGFRINNELLASPYVGIRYSRISSNGYTEVSTSDVTVPLTYNKLTQENIALLAGLKISAKLDPQTTLVASAGIEQNLKNRSGQYSATGVDGLTSIEFNSNPQKTRATASVGAYYDLDKTQRVSINGIYREETFSPTATTSLLATYTVGF